METVADCRTVFDATASVVEVAASGVEPPPPHPATPSSAIAAKKRKDRTRTVVLLNKHQETRFPALGTRFGEVLLDSTD
jgi:hypothetical protein